MKSNSLTRLTAALKEETTDAEFPAKLAKLQKLFSK